jgi:hypothetical protein
MTGPIIVDPGEEHGAANQLHVLATDFHGDAPDDPDGDGPDHRAARDLQRQIHATGRGLGTRLSDTGDKVNAATNALENQDQHNAGAIGKGLDASGFGSIMNAFLNPVGQAFSGVSQAVFNPLAQGFGQAINVAGQTIGQVTGAVAKNANIGAVDGGGASEKPAVTGGLGGATTPASGGPLGPPAKTADKPDEHVRFVSHQQPETVGGQPMPGMMPMMGGAGGGSGNALPGKVKQARIVTDKPTE